MISLAAGCRSGGGHAVPAQVHIPADKVIPPASIFGEGCRYDFLLMDDKSASFASGAKFHYAEYPYTAVLTFKEPMFDLNIGYSATPEDALKGFMEVHGNAGRPKIGMFGGHPSFSTVLFGRKPIHAVIVGNVSFVVTDLAEELGEQGCAEMAAAYVAFLEEHAENLAVSGGDDSGG